MSHSTKTLDPLKHREAAQWLYRGVWAWVVRWMRVPEDAPTLPGGPGQFHQSFQPSREFLSYMKFNFWLVFGVLGIVLISIWLFLLFYRPTLGIAFTAPVVGLLVIPATLSYLAIHLRYDTMWYVITDRSMRVRRGVWILHEVTITFENVQTVKVSQGPVQRWFGIGDVEVRTAGGGMVQTGNGAAIEGSGHHGVIEGVKNASDIRDLILAQLRHSKTAGLGDELGAAAAATTLPKTSALPPVLLTTRHLAVLREIRDAAVGQS